LNIWKKGIEIVGKTYSITREFPDEEKYCLTAQMRKSAASVPTNIAEGFARQSNKEYKHFLYIALGSCSELATQAVIATNLSCINSSTAEQLGTEVDLLSKMIMALIKKIN
jgi:four helix bundle protein